MQRPLQKKEMQKINIITSHFSKQKPNLCFVLLEIIFYFFSYFKFILENIAYDNLVKNFSFFDRSRNIFNFSSWELNAFTIN